MQLARAHALGLTVTALGVAAVAVVAIGAAYGFGAFGNAWLRPHWPWLVLALGAALLAIATYALCYRAVAAARGGAKLRMPLALRAVILGFAPFAPGGGFALDKRVLHAIEDDEKSATVRVLGLGALEWALLAPAAWLGAVVLLIVGDRRPMPSLLWPWAIAVPVGFVLGLSLTTEARRERIEAKGGRWRARLARAMNAIEILRSLVRSVACCWEAWVGMVFYWGLDIASFYGATRFIGLRLNLGELVVAYATGYALTRRSMPLGGAGVTEVLMTFSLHWVGQPVLPALAAVVVYRAFNLALPAVPALLVRRR
ncbi:MAG: lysylphosphatidylglycerol synthase domain-containing protein, partial [Solirubrobacteraceae bacterium]